MSSCQIDPRLIDEAVERIMSGWKHPLINRHFVRRAVAEEVCKGNTVMFKLIKAGNQACEVALERDGRQ